MPIIQINHPENLITRPLDDGAPIPLLDYIGELHKQSAEFRILKPGFNGDITPECFKDDPVIPPVDLRLKVDRTGEKGVITRTLPAGTPVACLGWIVDVDQIDTDIVTDRPTRTYFHVPASRDKATYLMAHRVRHSEEDTSLYLGGLIAHVALPQAKILKTVFSRPWPRVVDIVKPRTVW
jgi:hypothetical protein